MGCRELACGWQCHHRAGDQKPSAPRTGKVRLATLDGGLVATKPYVSAAAYIDKMSNYCKGCRFDPEKSTGPTACPFTTLYWDFLLQHESTLRKNPRMALQVRNLHRLDPPARGAIRTQAAELRGASDG
jgi:deoxyribodipyrimidine photolyase-related protein